MLHRHHVKQLAAVQKVLEESRTHTRARIEVVVARASGHYRDVDLLWGVFVGLTLLAIILYTPRPVAEHWVLVDVLLGVWMGRFVSSRSRFLQRLLTTHARRHHQALAGARAAFVTHEMDASRERTGVLVYYSHLEDALEIIPDVGVAAKVPGHRFHRIRHHFEKNHRRESMGKRLARVVHDVTTALTVAFPPVPETEDKA